MTSSPQATGGPKGPENWVTRLFNGPRTAFPSLFGWRPPLVTAGLIGFVVYSSGLLFAMRIGFASDYLGTRAIWATCFGIAWVLASVDWGLEQLPNVISEFAKCTNGSNDLRQWTKVFASNKGMLVCAAALYIFGWASVYNGMVANPRYPVSSVAMHILPPPSYEPPPSYNPQVVPVLSGGIILNPMLSESNDGVAHILPTAWYSPPLVPKFFLILYLGVFASLAAGTGFWLFIVNLPFLRVVMSQTVVLLPNILMAKFRVISDFYFIGTLAWFVGVFITVFISFSNISGLVPFLLLCAVIGLSAFMLPQFVFHALLVRAQNGLAEWRLRAYHVQSSNCSSQAELNLQDFDDFPRSEATWVYDKNDFVLLLVFGLASPVMQMVKTLFSPDLLK